MKFLKLINEFLISISDWLSGLGIFKFFELLGKLTILIALILYVAETGKRQKLNEYQAWQIINSARINEYNIHPKRGFGGDGGRRNAIMDLHNNNVVLDGIDLRGAKLLKLKLEKSSFLNSDLSATILDASNFFNSNFENSNIINSDMKNCNLKNVNFTNCDLRDTWFNGSDLEGVIFENANLEGVNLIGVKNCNCEQLKQAKNWQQTERDSLLRCGEKIIHVPRSDVFYRSGS